MLWARTLSRPRWAMPMTTSCAPSRVGHLEDLVEHRHDGVEPLDREHLLAEVGLLEVALEAEHLDQAVEQPLLLLGLERLAVPAGLDHVPQPHPLLVRGEVLDLVRDRPAVGLAHPGQDLEQRLALDADAEDLRRDLRHQLGGQVEVLGLDRRVALGLGAQRVEPGRQVAVGPVGLEQRGRGLDGLEQLHVRLRGDAGRLRAAGRTGRGQRRRGCRGGVRRGDGSRARRRGPGRPTRRSRPRPAAAPRSGAGRIRTPRPG